MALEEREREGERERERERVPLRSLNLTQKLMNNKKKVLLYLAQRERRGRSGAYFKKYLEILKKTFI